jgi:hypothetical protein
MQEMKVTMLLTFPETGGVVTNRNKSTKLKFEADASQFPQAVHLSAFPDFAVIEATFVLKEVAGKSVDVPEKKSRRARPLL